VTGAVPLHRHPGVESLHAGLLNQKVETPGRPDCVLGRALRARIERARRLRLDGAILQVLEGLRFDLLFAGCGRPAGRTKFRLLPSFGTTGHQQERK
jgi:hypothetical protein